MGTFVSQACQPVEIPMLSGGGGGGGSYAASPATASAAVSTPLGSYNKEFLILCVLLILIWLKIK